MSADLIERAAARIGGRRMAGAEPVSELPPSVAALPRVSSVDTVTRGSPAGEALADGSAGAKAGLMRAAHRISLDRSALSSAGIMTPESDATRMVEEFRVIKRPLLTKASSNATSSSDGTNVILVTSARPGEGKSFVACNLAMSVAADHHLDVVLVDADLRNPSVSRLLGLAPRQGLADLLTSSEAKILDVVLQTNFPNLFVLPAGETTTRSSELLASRRMTSIVQELATGGRGRIVIVDAAPLLASSEPAVLAHIVGQTLLVVEAERTGRRAVEEAVRHLSGCGNVSLVLNKARGWLSSEQFGTYYGEKYP